MKLTPSSSMQSRAGGGTRSSSVPSSRLSGVDVSRSISPVRVTVAMSPAKVVSMDSSGSSGDITPAR